jgi:hypothetical protein
MLRAGDPECPLADPLTDDWRGSGTLAAAGGRCLAVSASQIPTQLRHSALTHDADTRTPDADGSLRSYFGALAWLNKRECPPRLSLVTKPSAVRHGSGRTAGGGVRHCWEQSGSQRTGRR